MTESHEKKDGSCCKTSANSCCGSKKLFVGILVGLLIAAVAHGFVCGHGGMCGSAKMCPIMPSSSESQAPAH
ncbi:MAG: hypothetical protein JNN05_02525 [Candidatus Omnitrophica bacterium]|nr:hypothetical protein [Candidatus Omnitrophota bacterium]